MCASHEAFCTYLLRLRRDSPLFSVTFIFHPTYHVQYVLHIIIANFILILLQIKIKAHDEAPGATSKVIWPPRQSQFRLRGVVVGGELDGIVGIVVMVVAEGCVNVIIISKYRLIMT
jgi:hypothetical protein